MKNLNYSVNHNSYKLKGVEDLKAPTKMAAVLMYSCILHFSRSKAGHYDLYQRQWASDLGVSEDTIRKALQALQKNDHIIKLRDFQRKGNLPARYTTRSPKVYHQGPKGIPPGTTVNNYINNYKQKNDGFNKPHSSLNEGKKKLSQIEEYELLLQLEKKRNNQP